MEKKYRVFRWGYLINTKLWQVYNEVTFVLSGVLVAGFLMNSVINQSLENFYAIGFSMLGIVGALAAICYSNSSTYIEEKEFFRKVADRFLYSFVSLIAGLIFAGSIIHFSLYGILGYKNIIFLQILKALFGILSLQHLLKASDNFIRAFNLLLLLFSEKYVDEDNNPHGLTTTKKNVEEHQEV